MGKRLEELTVEGQEHWTSLTAQVTRKERRELLDLVVQTHTLELENMELELQLRLKDKMISDLQKEMEEMRMTMRRHGIDMDDYGDEADGPLLSERSNTVGNEDHSRVIEVQEEIIMNQSVMD